MLFTDVQSTAAHLQLFRPVHHQVAFHRGDWQRYGMEKGNWQHGSHISLDTNWDDDFRRVPVAILETAYMAPDELLWFST